MTTPPLACEGTKFIKWELSEALDKESKKDLAHLVMSLFMV
jgi:hypothetical protein